MTDKIYCTDPLGNSVCYDVHSIGMAILHSEIRSMTQMDLKRSLENPMTIIKISDEERLYCFGKKGAQVSLFVSNVILKDAVWYVKECTYLHDQNQILGLISKSERLYSR